MMKTLKIFVFLAASMILMAGCRNEDGLGESIFDTTTPAVDPTAATALYDQWLYDNFVVPYNTEMQYKFDYQSSDMSYVLEPADYPRVQLLTHFIQYLFYDVYSKYSPEKEVFMKKYGPRIFSFVGSSGYSATTGTEVLGTASGGVKITLYDVNKMKAYGEDVEYTMADVDELNERYFHTMHHEFSHILHQNKSYPVAFGQVTSGTYNSSDWQERDTTTTTRLGYVTNYASGRNTEDFVETISCIITDNDWRWMHRIIAASINGVASGDSVKIKTFVKNLGVEGLNDASAHWNKFSVYNETLYDEETDKYVATGNRVLDIYRSEETVYSNTRGQYVAKYNYTLDRTYTSFMDDFMENLTVTSEAKSVGMSALLQKISIATTWYSEKWGMNLYTLREELRQRQKTVNDYVHDKSKVQIYPLK